MTGNGRTKGIELAPVLIVEDESSDAELARLALRQGRLRNEIVILHTIPLARDYLMRQGDFTVLKKPLPILTFLDIKINGGFSGLDLLEELRGHTGTELLHIVILTGSGTRRDKIRALELGASAYVQKPLTNEKVRQIMSELNLGYAILR